MDFLLEEEMIDILTFCLQNPNSNEIDFNKVYNAMNTFYEDLLDIEKKIGSNKETLKFLDAYNVNISELLAVMEIEECLKLLMIYDHEHKEVYKSYLKK